MSKLSYFKQMTGKLVILGLILALLPQNVLAAQNHVPTVSVEVGGINGVRHNAGAYVYGAIKVTPEVMTEYKKVAYVVRESTTADTTSSSIVLPIIDSTGGNSACEWSKSEAGNWYFKVDIVDSAGKVVTTAKSQTFTVHPLIDESNKKKTDLAFENISLNIDPTVSDALELSFDVVNYGASITSLPEGMCVKVSNKTTLETFIINCFNLSDFLSGKKSVRWPMPITGHSLKKGKNLLVFEINHNFIEDNKLNNRVEKWVDTESFFSPTSETPDTDTQTTSLPDLVLNDVQIIDENGLLYFNFIIKNNGVATQDGQIVSIKAVDVETGEIYSSGYSSSLSGVKEVISAGPLADKKIGSAYKLKAEIDYAGIIRESNENNNTLEKTLIIDDIKPTSLPDLVLNDIQIVDDNGVPYLNFVINNKGGAIANGYIISVIAKDVETGDVYASGYSSGLIGVKEIIAGEPLVVKKTGSAYKLKAEIDYAGIIRESNENNNTLEKALTMGDAQPAGLPDLVLNDVQIFNEKGVPYLKFVINNKGEATQNGQIVSVKAEDVETGEIYSSGYSSGLSGIQEILSAGPLAVKKTISPYKLKVEIDHVGIIRESNENNNTLERTLTMTKAQPIKVENNSNDKDSLIIKLKRQISELETKLVETEKKLVTKVDDKLFEKIKGKILLQVEEKGEAWYVDPVSKNKLYLKDGESAYDIMRVMGLGISNVNLTKIPVGTQSASATTVDLDTDGDGLSDDMEKALGSDPNKADTDDDGYKDSEELKTNYQFNGKGKQTIDGKLVTKLKGRIVLQVENKGEAWYINPSDGKRYFLGNGDKAYQIMRELSLGINNSDLRKIKVGEFVTE